MGSQMDKYAVDNVPWASQWAVQFWSTFDCSRMTEADQTIIIRGPYHKDRDWENDPFALPHDLPVVPSSTKTTTYDHTEPQYQHVDWNSWIWVAPPDSETSVVELQISLFTNQLSPDKTPKKRFTAKQKRSMTGCRSVNDIIAEHKSNDWSGIHAQKIRILERKRRKEDGLNPILKDGAATWELVDRLGYIPNQRQILKYADMEGELQNRQTRPKRVTFITNERDAQSTPSGNTEGGPPEVNLPILRSPEASRYSTPVRLQPGPDKGISLSPTPQKLTVQDLRSDQSLKATFIDQKQNRKSLQIDQAVPNSLPKLTIVANTPTNARLSHDTPSTPKQSLKDKKEVAHPLLDKWRSLHPKIGKPTAVNPDDSNLLQNAAKQAIKMARQRQVLWRKLNENLPGSPLESFNNAPERGQKKVLSTLETDTDIEQLPSSWTTKSRDLSRARTPNSQMKLTNPKPMSNSGLRASPASQYERLGSSPQNEMASVSSESYTDSESTILKLQDKVPKNTLVGTAGTTLTRSMVSPKLASFLVAKTAKAKPSLVIDTVPRVFTPDSEQSEEMQRKFQIGSTKAAVPRKGRFSTPINRSRFRAQSKSQFSQLNSINEQPGLEQGTPALPIDKIQLDETNER